MGVSLSFSNGETLHLLLTLSVLLVAVHSVGFLFVKLRQPRVAGEIIAGLALLRRSTAQPGRIGANGAPSRGEVVA
jgi:Kef-type K+ transport system membrane component KefB